MNLYMSSLKLFDTFQYDMDLVLLETSLKINAVQTSSSHSPLNILLKHFPVAL